MRLTKYSGWVTLFLILGTLAAIAAIAIQQGFIAATTLFLTQGEWELLAITFYAVGILLYLMSPKTQHHQG